MFRRNREPVIYIGPRPPRRRRRKLLAGGLLIALIAALVLAPGRPSLRWQPEEACAEHVACTITNWWGNWVSIAKVYIQLKEVFNAVIGLQHLISAKWEQFMQYKRRIDYALSLLRNPEEAIQIYLRLYARGDLSDYLRSLQVQLERRGVSATERAVQSVLKNPRARVNDWMDLVTLTRENAQALAKAVKQARVVPTRAGKESPEEAARKADEAIQLQLPEEPSTEELTQAAKAANPASAGEAMKWAARSAAARKFAQGAISDAITDAAHANAGLEFWQREFGRKWQEIDRAEYTAAIKTIAKLTIQNQILLQRLLRQVAETNIAVQTLYSHQMAAQARRAVEEAQAEATTK